MMEITTIKKGRLWLAHLKHNPEIFSEDPDRHRAIGLLVGKLRTVQIEIHYEEETIGQDGRIDLSHIRS